MKRLNRKSEFLLHDVELLCTLAMQINPSGYRYSPMNPVNGFCCVMYPDCLIDNL